MKKLHTKKRRINSKKGISMVLAMALVAVLFLSTTTFLSIAMLQQNETGTTMNSRQAYVSAKSALDVAEELLNEGKISLPADENHPKYYIFYYESGKSDIQVLEFSSAEEALKEIEELKKNSKYTVIGNAYIKITKNSDGSYTITAVGAENKYTGSDTKNTGDISAKFEVTYTSVEKSVNRDVKMHQKTIQTTSTPTSNNFFMMGDQASYSLLKSIDSGDYRTLSTYASDNSKKDIIYIIRPEAGTTPITSNFPLVFDKAVQIDSNSGTRLNLTSYDNGIYLLGDYTAQSTDQTVRSNNNLGSGAVDLCMYTNNDSFGINLNCRFLVIGGNVVCKESNTPALQLGYSGSSYNDDKGVVVKFTRECYFKKYKGGTNYSTVTYKKGYYYIPVGENGYVDLFKGPDALGAYTIDISNNEYQRVSGIDNYNYIETRGKQNIHAAHEDDNVTGLAKVEILHKNGTFNGGLATNSPMSTATANWDTYYTYCSPSATPDAESNNKYYTMYAGQEFNYLWYNTQPMTVNSHVAMDICSKSINLTIGPDMGETVYKYTSSSNSIYCNQTNIPTDSNFKQTGLYTASGSNKIIQSDSSASFTLRPYFDNDETCALTVPNDFDVKLADDSSYTVKANTYTICSKTNSIAQNKSQSELLQKGIIVIPDGERGLNLFSSYAKSVFESISAEPVDSTDNDVKWVDASTKTINSSDDVQLDQSQKIINFTAENGGTLKDGTYKARAINFKTNTNSIVYGNNATLQADIVSLDGGIISSFEYDTSGNLTNHSKGGLKINTTSAGKDSYCEVSTSTTVANENESITYEKLDEGFLIEVKSTTTLILSDKRKKELKPGYYYFPKKGNYDILSAAFWKQWVGPSENTDLSAPAPSNAYYYIVTTLDTNESMATANYQKDEMNKVSFEGKYC